MKYIFVSGGVISGIGKGIATASIALLLKAAGFKVVPLKMDPYLNVDAGTMNPIVHGETFVLDDGTETDQDLGHYERFLNQNLDKSSISTQGSIFLSVIQRERAMGYNGECVDMVTSVTDEIMARIKETGKKSDSEIVLVEIGGTTGEYQNVLFLEANRMMKLRYPNDVIHIHITYLPIPKSIGEMKSKPAQMSVRDLHAVGIQPDIILARAEHVIDALRLKKLSVATGLEEEDVVSAPDVSNVYEVPLNFEDGKLTDRVLSKLGLTRKQTDLKEWREFISNLGSFTNEIRIGIVGKYFATGDYVLADSYISVLEALKHAGAQLHTKVKIEWIDAHNITEDQSALASLNGIIVPGGFGARDVEGKIRAIQYARENKVPYLGLCYGMQLAAIEFARNVMGFKDANSTEIDPNTSHPIIHIMPDQEKKLLQREYGASMRLGAWDCSVKPNTLASKVYNQSDISERHRHRYEVNNEYRDEFDKQGMKISGTSPDGNLVEIMELSDHPYFIGSQFHPELKSRPISPHPLFLGLVEAALKFKK
jgi:CTP synthase